MSLSIEQSPPQGFISLRTGPLAVISEWISDRQSPRAGIPVRTQAWGGGGVRLGEGLRIQKGEDRMDVGKRQRHEESGVEKRAAVFCLFSSA